MRRYVGVTILIVSLFSALPASALTFLQGTVKDSDGNLLSNTSVYLSCYNYSAYKYLWQSTTTDSSGEYGFNTNYYYGPCGSYYSGTTYTCSISSYVYSSADLVADAKSTNSPSIVAMWSSIIWYTKRKPRRCGSR